MKYFVEEGSVVREIWGKADTILFIFAGASAEFALNKAVDWLYFTGKLPSDPLERLFSTVDYARQIVFSEYHDALRAIDVITAIHRGVEEKRGAQIPDSAYRDVLFMLIDYSVRSFEVLERKLTGTEKAEIFEVFYQVGARMGIRGLPENYENWEIMRAEHLHKNLVASTFTADLFQQYRKHLGVSRYLLLKEVQALVVPREVRKMLKLGRIPFLLPVLAGYKLARIFNVAAGFRNIILPKAYKTRILNLDLQPAEAY
ncbi:oxygenase MpaB family protein [Dyadobacter helix]|nr:oxygenase MpaB family protein [Dyadobacter sp. CECT 9275]